MTDPSEQPSTEKQKRRKPPHPLHSKPWFPPNWDIADAGAIQALVRGDAMPHQQQRALKFIVEKLCATYDVSFRPGGLEGQRETDFAEAKRWVGLQIIKLTVLNLHKLTKEPDDARTTES